tara:strand:+ start:1185 stop:1553 length:369 start_codon:yes stop_codon:yes gene_type:complete
MTPEEMLQQSKDDFIKRYGEGTQLITWGVAEITRDVSDDFAHTFIYHVYGNDGVNNSKYEGTITLDKPETLNTFSSLTEDQLITSIKAKLGSSAVTTIENNLKTKLNEAAATPTTAEGMPWS